MDSDIKQAKWVRLDYGNKPEPIMLTSHTEKHIG